MKLALFGQEQYLYWGHWGHFEDEAEGGDDFLDVSPDFGTRAKTVRTRSSALGGSFGCMWSLKKKSDFVALCLMRSVMRAWYHSTGPLTSWIISCWRLQVSHICNHRTGGILTKLWCKFILINTSSIIRPAAANPFVQSSKTNPVARPLSSS